MTLNGFYEILLVIHLNYYHHVCNELLNDLINDFIEDKAVKTLEF